MIEFGRFLPLPGAESRTAERTNAWSHSFDFGLWSDGASRSLDATARQSADQALQSMPLHSAAPADSLRSSILKKPIDASLLGAAPGVAAGNPPTPG